MSQFQNLEEIFLLPETEKFSGYGKSSIYAKVRNGTFPSPVRLGPRRIGWTKSSLLEWQRERIAESNSGKVVA